MFSLALLFAVSRPAQGSNELPENEKVDESQRVVSGSLLAVLDAETHVEPLGCVRMFQNLNGMWTMRREAEQLCRRERQGKTSAMPGKGKHEKAPTYVPVSRCPSGVDFAARSNVDKKCELQKCQIRFDGLGKVEMSLWWNGGPMCGGLDGEWVMLVSGCFLRSRLLCVAPD